MCGIHVGVRRRARGRRSRSPTSNSANDDGAPAVATATAAAAREPDWLLRRGPDHCNTVTELESSCCTWSNPLEEEQQSLYEDDEFQSRHHHSVIMQASVLQMRESLVSQPICLYPSHDEGNRSPTSSRTFLAWNGEVYQVLTGEGEVEDVWDHRTSDTELVAKLIREAWFGGDHGADGPHSHQVSTEPHPWLSQLVHGMARLVNAEYAFCAVRWPFIFYGRDVWGRRSLLRCDGADWILSSVAGDSHDDGGGRWEEVKPGSIHCYNLLNGTTVSHDVSMASVRVQNPLLVKSTDIVDASLQLEHVLREAVRRRAPPNRPASILFSGGVDSVVLAAMALKVCDPAIPLYLINVAFVHDTQDDSVAADTAAAQASYDDLVRAYPSHSIVFLQEKVPWQEMVAHQERVRSLVAPKATVMDLNIGAALWFASRAAPTRVLLTGLGADEQMGGYGRHRKAWERGSLREELELDLGRLWERNLGRDDRVLSDHGKEARFPYLDSHVVEFLRCQELDHICDLALPPGVGDKRILRLVAERLGCVSASAAVKRAIQFGSRIAHVSDRQRFGSRRKASGEKMLPRA